MGTTTNWVCTTTNWVVIRIIERCTRFYLNLRFLGSVAPPTVPRDHVDHHRLRRLYVLVRNLHAWVSRRFVCALIANSVCVCAYHSRWDAAEHAVGV